MYFPYLRGKQFELKALREFSREHIDNNYVTPIIEAVNSNYGALNTAILDMFAYNMRFALIMNPPNGDFVHSNIVFNILAEDNKLHEKKDLWIAAYLYRDSPHELNNLVQNSPFNNIMIVFKDSVEFVDNNLLKAIVNDEKVSYIVFNDKSISRRSKVFLKKLSKNLIGLTDCFNEKSRNSDYKENEDEFFSDMPFYYSSEENLYGFSDYTALSSKYSEGGMMPYAIAIHLTYKKDEDLINIHHFVSDSDWSRADIRGKFMEAAQKVKEYYEHNNIPITDAVQDLINRVSDNEEKGYPGLGYLKKLSILNHLELIHKILVNNVNQQ